MVLSGLRMLRRAPLLVMSLPEAYSCFFCWGKCVEIIGMDRCVAEGQRTAL